MPYDPNYSPTNAPVNSAPLRTNLNGLKAEIDTKPATGDTARNPLGQVPNLDPNWQPNDPPTAADLIWIRDRMVEIYSATAR